MSPWSLTVGVRRISFGFQVPGPFGWSVSGACISSEYPCKRLREASYNLTLLVRDLCEAYMGLHPPGTLVECR